MLVEEMVLEAQRTWRRGRGRGVLLEPPDSVAMRGAAGAEPVAAVVCVAHACQPYNADQADGRLQ